MKIAFIAPASDIHTVRWVNTLAIKGNEVHLITMHPPNKDKINSEVTIHKLPFKAPLGYYSNKIHAKRIINNITPDIVNTHYASGYGTLSRLINYHPTLLSVWGSDVYDFPYESNFKMKIIKRNLHNATEIASTSWVMKKQTEKLLDVEKVITVTPFGVDLKKFTNLKKYDNNRDKIIIGTVKKLEEKYGVRYLIQGFSKLINRLSEEGHTELVNNIELLIVGKGSQLDELVSLCTRLDLADKTTFVDSVPHEEVPIYLNKFDIYCAPSTLDSESFGVAIIEASACELPVIVSNVGGLPEVVKDGETGLVIEPKNDVEIASALYKLIFSENMRKDLGRRGRKLIEKEYDWDHNVELMLNTYRTIIEKTKNK